MAKHLRTPRVAIVGAGIGGLAAAVDLARAGIEVIVCEKAASPGGKLRRVSVDGVLIDAGPTVVTMKWVFESLFEAAGLAFADAVPAVPLDILARHSFDDGTHLDLYADVARSADAIGRLAGAKAAHGFLDFAKRAEATYTTLEVPFIRSEQPNPASLALGAGLRGLGDLWRISPFTTLWKALGDYFADPRLRQLFARYATYCGSSPFDCPATLMLVAHVEQKGVWVIDGGMQRLAEACHALAVRHGVTFRFDTDVSSITVESGAASGLILAGGERVAADAIILNADPSALSSGQFGTAASNAITPAARSSRSLSAITFAAHARTSGLALEHHNVFFGRDYAQEFADIFRYSRIPGDPTVYLCAQDRTPFQHPAEGEKERLFLLVNAPPTGDIHKFASKEVEQCMTRILSRLSRSGLEIERLESAHATTPTDFNRLFPATGGALYGQASHGWTASFTRPAARTRCPRLYLAGGAVHPGPGVPMAALSGRIAARAVVADLTSHNA